MNVYQGIMLALIFFTFVGCAWVAYVVTKASERGECKSTSKYVNEFTCSACGFEYDFITDPYQGPNYCPNCGRRVMDA